MTQPDPRSPWHAGELALQRSIGAAGRMAGLGSRLIRDHLIEQHREFFEALSYVVIGTVDGRGDVWASFRVGAPGFLHSPTPWRLDVHLDRDPSDPSEPGLGDGASIALLGIDIATRRRNRLNGTVQRSRDDAFSIEVAQSYGNCPQYIQLRAPEPAPTVPAKPATASRSNILRGRARALVETADTFFVASYITGPDEHRQIDVSHRGGRPGFVRVDAAGTLTIPDFHGNNFFNTLGNIAVNPRAGLIFIDFASGDVVQLTGSARLLLDSTETLAFDGAERLWSVSPATIVYREGALPLRFDVIPGGEAPENANTGSWSDVARRAGVAGDLTEWRPYKVVRAVSESVSVRSLYLAPVGTGDLPPHQAGQFLPIRVRCEEGSPPLERTYSLSLAPSDHCYRLSIKAEGRVSRRLHQLAPGDQLEAKNPEGAFVIDAATAGFTVLIAGGIGITPLLAMLRELVNVTDALSGVPRVLMFYAAHSIEERAFDSELQALVARAPHAVRLIRLLGVGDTASPKDYDVIGRINAGLLARHLPSPPFDVYVCGPSTFMQGVYDALRSLDVPDARIHAEAFGPGALRRSAGPGIHAAPANAAVDVRFARSGMAATWAPGRGSLLELAESSGLQPPFSCRIGVCGSCRTRVLSGNVAYISNPTAEIAPDEALLCCAVPAQVSDESAQLRLDA